jgi:hypothetical protein
MYINIYTLMYIYIYKGINSVEDASLLTVSEIGDGNVNFVYIIEGPSGTDCIHIYIHTYMNICLYVHVEIRNMCMYMSYLY